MIYRKRGSVVRWENGTLVRVTESGVAIEEGERFECRPERSRLRHFEASSVLPTVRAIRDLVRPVSVERLIVTHGIAEHECDGRAWSEETQRFHLSMVRGPLRALVDATSGRLDDIAPIAAALARAETEEREAPERLRVAPCVAAALLPSLHDHVGVVQTAGGVDGYGHPIVEAEGEPWPNWYRPSYRMRPVRMPLNVSLPLNVRGEADEVDRDLPLAIALLAPPQRNAARVLLVDGDRVYPAQIRVTRVRAAAAEHVWYPYGGGSFGAELML